MSIIEIFFVALGLSADAFAVSLCKGLCMQKIDYRQAAVISGTFGVFQAVMPLLGWVIGERFESYLAEFSHWVAFALLLMIGGKMLLDVIGEKGETPVVYTSKLDWKQLLLMAVATSIDAFAVGLTIALLESPIWLSVSIIGIVTLAVCFAGVLIGNRFGAKFKKKAQIAGGAVLILIGIKILLEHFGVIPF